MNHQSAIAHARNHEPHWVPTEVVHEMVHGTTAMGRFNTRAAVKITQSVGSMWCAYVFAIIALISLPAAISTHSPIIIIGWIAQTFLQLVLLPIIIVGQNVQAAATEARAQSDHETLIAIHTLASEVHKIDEQQTRILNLLAQKSDIALDAGDATTPAAGSQS